jgi:hypothetical protein
MIGFIDAFFYNHNSSQSIYCLGLTPFSFACLSSRTTSELPERYHVSSLYNFGEDRIEITTSNSSSTIVCLFVVTCYPATDGLLLLRA